MRNFLFLLASLTSYFVALPSYAVEFCNMPYSEPIEGEVAVVGQAVDSDRDRFKVLNAFKGRVVEVGGGTASLNASLVRSDEEIFEKTYQKFRGKITIGKFSFGKSRKFTNIVVNRKYTSTFVLSFDATLPNDKWDIDTNGGSPLTDYAKSLAGNACQFKQIFGNSFIFQTHRGARVYIAINVSFSSSENYQEFIRKMDGNLEGAFKGWTGEFCCGIEKTFTIPKFDFSASFKQSNINLNDLVRQDGKIEIAAMQIGGDVSRLGQIFGTGQDIALASCSLSALDNCDKAFKNVLAYLTQEEFINGVRSSPSVLNYLSRPYWEVDPSIKLVEEVTSTIENARIQLATELTNHEQDLDTLKKLLASSLTAVHRQELTILQPKLEQDIQKLTVAGFTCFSDLASCESTAIQALGSLATYNKSLLQFYPNDGLVAYYPFNSNSLDESGNNNNGTVNGATLTSDRFGKPNSAYKFDGVNDYISIKNSDSLNPANITISAWYFGTQFFTGDGNNVIIHKPYTSHVAPYYQWHLGVGTQLYPGSFNFHGWPTSVSRSISSGAISTTDVIDKWNHLVTSFDGVVLKLYINGKLEASQSLSSYSPIVPYNKDVFIGRHGNAGNQWDHTPGIIDDIYIYSRSLGNDEIQRLYTNKSTNNSSERLEMNAVIESVEKGNINAVWIQGGEDTTVRGDKVIWGYFHANPTDVTWGDKNNPDLFVKIWFDASGRTDVNFFHVSVPDILVSSVLDGVSNTTKRATTAHRYVRHYYQNNQPSVDYLTTNEVVPSTAITGLQPTVYSTIKGLNIGAAIETLEKGFISAAWKLGGTGVSKRGDQVAWGYFYADPKDVSWGNLNNPEVYVKIWFDISGRVDVNFFHVSVPKINVFSGFGSFQKVASITTERRYTRHEYTLSK